MRSVKPKSATSAKSQVRVRLKRIFAVWDLVLELGPGDDPLLKALEEVEAKKIFSAAPDKPYEVEVMA